MTVAQLIAGLTKVRGQWGGLVQSTLAATDRCPWYLTVNLICARIWYETRGNPRATSKPQSWAGEWGGEVGLLQLSPTTRAAVGLSAEEAMDPATNLRVGIALWCRWVGSFRAWARKAGIVAPEMNPVGLGALAWLVTAIGPGAVRYLARSFGSSDPETWPVNLGHRVYAEGAAAGKFGSQSAGLVRRRIKVAINAARAAHLADTAPAVLCLLGGAFLA